MRLILLRAVTSEVCQNFVAHLQSVLGVTDKGPTNLLVDWYFSLATSFGDEAFYVAALPVVIWFIDFATARKVFLAWMISLYIGQLLKDCLKLPRPRDFPSSPPSSPRKAIITLEKTYECEFGFPSTHVMAGMLPFYACYSLDPSLLQDSKAFSFCLIYLVSVGFSRLYKGVHSVVDVLAGFVIGTCILSVLAYFGNMIDSILMSSIGSALLIIFTVIIFVLYPKQKPYSASIGLTAIICAAAVGFLVASWAVFHVSSLSSISNLLEMTSWYHSSNHSIQTAILQYVSGIALTLIIGFVSRFVFDLFVKKVPISDLNNFYTHEIYSKFAKYGVMGFGVIISPMIWQRLKLF